MSAVAVIFTSATTLDIIIFNNSFSAQRDCECQILLCWILFAFRYKNNSLPKITSEYYLNVFWLIHVHVNSCAWKLLCVHACHRARNLSSPVVLQMKWSYIPDHLYRILIIGGSRSGKTNALLHLIKQEDEIDKIYLYAKDLSEPRYELLIKKSEYAGTKHFSD